MKIKKRSPRKKEVMETEEIKGKIQELYARAGQIFDQYRIAATIALIVIITLFVGGASYYYLLQKWDRKAAEMTDHAYSVYLEGDFEGALTEYQKILEEYPSSKNAAVVMYYIGNSYTGMGQLDKAIQTYQEVIKRFKSEETVRSLSYLKLGYAYMDKKDYTNAISSFKEASIQKTSFVADRASYEIARAYDISGDKVSAIEHYETLIETYPNSPWKQDATAKLNMLTGGPDQQEKEPQQGKKDPEDTDKP